MTIHGLKMLPLLFLAAGCEEPRFGVEPRSTTEVNVPAVSAVSAPAYWNGIARGLVAEHGSSPYVAARVFAMVGIAQYNGAVAAGESPRGNRNTAIRAAVTRASVDALAQLYPARAAILAQLGEAFLAEHRRPEDRLEDEASGASAGAAAAAAVIQNRTNDGFAVPWSGTLPTGPGVWYSSTVPPSAPVQPYLGLAKPFILEAGNQFRPAPPPAFGSAEFLAALAEVRYHSDTRTAEQDSIARFWALPGGTYTPIGYWNDEAAKLIERYRMSDLRAAHLFALLNMVGADALIASHEAKYTYWLIRPSQADPGIQLSVGLPNFPSYPSNHSTLSAGMARILGAGFPAERSRLDALAEQASKSRLYGGIHYRFDNEAGLGLGRAIAAWALGRSVKEGQPIPLD